MDSCKGESTSPGRVVKSAVDLDRLIEDFGCWQEVCVCGGGGGGGGVSFKLSIW